jgi:hypothetical protein
MIEFVQPGQVVPNLDLMTGQDYDDWIGRQVRKRGKPGCAWKKFRSKSSVNTVKGIILHPILVGKPAFTFEEDDSYVDCHSCLLVDE